MDALTQDQEQRILDGVLEQESRRQADAMELLGERRGEERRGEEDWVMMKGGEGTRPRWNVVMMYVCLMRGDIRSACSMHG